MRFISPHLDTAPWDKKEEAYWMPVDLYVGGAEHAVLHLLYSRFWHHVLYDIGWVSTPEPFERLVNQGMIHHTSYRDRKGKYHYHDQVEERQGKWFVKSSDEPVEVRREKMSKSRYNTVNPDSICEDFGADALRLYELFMGPIEDANDWDSSGVAGMRRFLDRLWRLLWDDRSNRLHERIVEGPLDSAAIERALHSAIKKVTESVESLRFNTAISEMMVFVNQATQAERLAREWIESFVKILFPFAPHLTSEIWARLGNVDDLMDAGWPSYDEGKLQVEKITIAVQVDGKLRATIEVPATIAESEVFALAKAHPRVASFLHDKGIEKEFYVPGRLVNLVTK
jgi:leucyl-tRNA synthetase